MDLSNLKPAAGATKSSTRIGRGEGSGKVVLQQKDIRSKIKIRIFEKVGFEGGQMPLQRRVRNSDSNLLIELNTKQSI